MARSIQVLTRVECSVKSLGRQTADSRFRTLCLASTPSLNCQTNQAQASQQHRGRLRNVDQVHRPQVTTTGQEAVWLKQRLFNRRKECRLGVFWNPRNQLGFRLFGVDETHAGDINSPIKKISQTSRRNRQAWVLCQARRSLNGRSSKLGWEIRDADSGVGNPPLIREVR